MGKPELEFHTPTQTWTPTSGEAAGISEQILARDEATGAYTRLLRFQPGADSTPSGTQVHDFWEEVFIVKGDLTDLRLGQRFTEGMYACRPPGMEHGPWCSEAGALLLEIRTPLSRS